MAAPLTESRANPVFMLECRSLRRASPDQAHAVFGWVIEITADAPVTVDR